jgi:Fe-Mn family superoxide dismutase
MDYSKKDFSKLKGMDGFSDKALDLHFALYEGYVNNTNLIFRRLEKLQEKGEAEGIEYAELKRRLGWEFDGMKLHEYYFSSLGGNGKIDEAGKLHAALVKNFGSFEKWEDDFKATAKMRGIGWAVLYQDPENERLINFWVNEHNENHPVGLKLILNLDVFEHAYMIDYGKDRASYSEAFLKNIDWKEVEKRFK